ncbi:MAG: DUF6069 family protein [Kineosporiaceae bacterium]
MSDGTTPETTTGGAAEGPTTATAGPAVAPATGDGGAGTVRTGPPTWARRLVTVLTAAGLNAAVWLVAVRVAGVDLVVDAPGQGRQEIGIGVVVLATVAAGLAAWVLLAVLRRVWTHGAETWTVIAAVVTALSLAAPLLSEGTVADRAVLGLMHVVAAVTVVGGFRRASR